MEKMKMSDDWNEITDGNENGESEFEGEIWKPEMVDEALIGKYVEIEENVGTNNDSTLYHIRNENGELFKVWGSKVLDGLFKKVPLNSMVKLVYKGKKKSQKGFYYKVYKLFSKQGGEGASASSSSTVEKPENTNQKDLEDNGAKVMQVGPTDEEINRIADQQIQKANGNWYKIIEQYLPKNKEDLEDPEKVAAEYINRLRSDIIGTGVKNVTPKMIRDNVVILVEDGNTVEEDLGKLDEEKGKMIFKLLRKVDGV